MSGWRLGIALVVSLGIGSANAETTSWERSEISLAEVAAWVRKFEFAMRINTDPVLRAIVCRIPYAHFTPKTLTMAIANSPERVLHALRILEGRSLIMIVGAERWDGLIVPTSEEARQKMRDFAQRWCRDDDECAALR